MKIEELYNNEWISLKKIVAPEKGIRGYVYSHETRCNGSIISILPYRKVFDGNGSYKLEYLLKSEVTPCWSPNEPYLSTITGGFEGGYPIDDAIRELREETGYEAKKCEFIYLDTSWGSKSSDTIYSLFSVNLTCKPQGEIKGDGSRLEAEAEAVWVTEDKISRCKDPQASVILLRLKRFLGKKL